VVHFYRPTTRRCEIVDKHFYALAAKHMETKFLRVNAEKAPFLVEKLHIWMLPTIVCVQNGPAPSRAGDRAAPPLPFTALALDAPGQRALTCDAAGALTLYDFAQQGYRRVAALGLPDAVALAAALSVLPFYAPELVVAGATASPTPSVTPVDTAALEHAPDALLTLALQPLEILGIVLLLVWFVGGPARRPGGRWSRLVPQRQGIGAWSLRRWGRASAAARGALVPGRRVCWRRGWLGGSGSFSP
jgi:hypothetical protein